MKLIGVFQVAQQHLGSMKQRTKLIKEMIVMKITHAGLILAGSLLLNVSFAATATCQVTNNKTGQSFSADGGGPTQEIAHQVARSKALEKCHAESTGWPGKCFVSQCNPS